VNKPAIPFELHIALRYLLAKRKQAFISVISLISTIGVTVGVMAVVIALAVMTGLQGELRDRILGSNAHIYVSKTSGGIVDYRAEAAKLSELPHVTGAAPALMGQGLLSAGREQAPVQIKGIDPELEPRVTDLKRALKSGSFEALATPPNGRPGILLGTDLAAQLGVAVGDSVSLVTAQGTLTPNGPEPFPRRFRVAGIFNLGLYEFDDTFAFVTLPMAMRLFDKDQVDYIQLRLDDIYAAPEIARSIPQRFGHEYYAQDWAQLNKALFSALTLEKIAVSLAIGLIVIVAALNIVTSLILLVMEKGRDIAILKTMGTSARSVTAIFMMQGLIIGLVGTTVGGLGGFAISRFMDRYHVIRMSVEIYQVSYLPFKVLPRDFALVLAGAVLICFVATIYPSRQAARLDPAQALRYE
jgi:lipoprotein-releasing system permease protein